MMRAINIMVHLRHHRLQDHLDSILILKRMTVMILVRKIKVQIGILIKIKVIKTELEFQKTEEK